MTGSLTYVKGDATQPAGEGPRFIIHCCNDLGRWGRGFVVALSNRWAEPEALYRTTAYKQKLELGSIQIAGVGCRLWVVNMIGQHGIRSGWDGLPPIRYEAIRDCLTKVAEAARLPEYTADGEFDSVGIHAPKFGAGLAGGDWTVIEQLIQEELVDKGLSVTVYEFDG